MVTVQDPTLPPPGDDETPPPRRVRPPAPPPVASLRPRTPRARTEPRSPFVAWADRGEPIIEDGAIAELRASRNLLVEIVSDPEAFAERLLDPAQLQAVILSTLSAAVAGAAVFAAMVRLDEGAWVMLSSAGRLALSVTLAVAAALGPIHAVSVLMAARIPLARLVAVALSATAAGAMLLAPLGPVVRLAHHHDAMWWGPLALLGSFVASALFAGHMLHQALYALARVTARARTGEPRGLSEGDRFRVGVVARMSVLFLAYTAVLSAFALRAFG